MLSKLILDLLSFVIGFVIGSLIPISSTKSFIVSSLFIETLSSSSSSSSSSSASSSSPSCVPSSSPSTSPPSSSTFSFSNSSSCLFLLYASIHNLSFSRSHFFFDSKSIFNLFSINFLISFDVKLITSSPRSFKITNTSFQIKSSVIFSSNSFLSSCLLFPKFISL